MGNDASRYEEALQNHQQYANCHSGHSFLNAENIMDNHDSYITSVHPFMKKAYALRTIMGSADYQKYSHIVWVDRDAIFMDHSISIYDSLKTMDGSRLSWRGDYDLYVGTERWAWLNSGVLIFRNSDFGRQLVDDWIATYTKRGYNYLNTADTIRISGEKKTFSDLFERHWSCEDQGALIALLAGYTDTLKWETDRFDGLTKPHFLHTGDQEWTDLSSKIILGSKYQFHVKVVAQELINSNPWDHEKYLKTLESNDRKVQNPFIFHFNGQKNKPELVHRYTQNVVHCKRGIRAETS